MNIEEKDLQTTGGKTFYGSLPVLFFGCQHKNIYQGYWFRGKCMDCGEYVPCSNTAEKILVEE